MDAPNFKLTDQDNIERCFELEKMAVLFLSEDDTPGCTTACNFRDNMEIINKLNQVLSE